MEDTKLALPLPDPEVEGGKEAVEPEAEEDVVAERESWVVAVLTGVLVDPVSVELAEAEALRELLCAVVAVELEWTLEEYSTHGRYPAA